MVLIFKTDIEKHQDKQVYKLLSAFSSIEQISVDYEDCDKVLRVVSSKNLIDEIIELLNKNDIFCEELE